MQRPTHMSGLVASPSAGSHVQRPSQTSDHAAAVRMAYGMLAPSSGAGSSRALSSGVAGGGSGVGGSGLAGGSGVGGYGLAGGSGVGGYGLAGGSGAGNLWVTRGSNAVHASATHGPGGVPYGTPLPDRSQPQNVSRPLSFTGAAAGGEVGSLSREDSGAAAQSPGQAPSPFVAGVPWRNSKARRTPSNSDSAAAGGAAAAAQQDAAEPQSLAASGSNAAAGDGGRGASPVGSSEERRAYVVEMAGRVRQWAAMYGKGDGAEWRAGLAAARDGSVGIVRMLELLAAWEPGDGKEGGEGSGGAAGRQLTAEPAGPVEEDGCSGATVPQASGKGAAAASAASATGAVEAAEETVVVMGVARALGSSEVRALLGALQLTARLEVPCTALLRCVQQQQKCMDEGRAKQRPRPRRRSLVLLLGCCGQQGGGGGDGGTGRGTQRSREELELAAVAAGLRSTLAWVKASGGRAEEGAEDARASYVELRGALGERHPDTLDALGVLAQAVLECGRREEAWELGTRLVELRRGAMGEEHPDTIRCVLCAGVARAAKHSGRRRGTAKAGGVLARHRWLTARCSFYCSPCGCAAQGLHVHEVPAACMRAHHRLHSTRTGSATRKPLATCAVISCCCSTRLEPLHHS